jgi:hypothetical protein
MLSLSAFIGVWNSQSWKVWATGEKEGFESTASAAKLELKIPHGSRQCILIGGDEDAPPLDFRLGAYVILDLVNFLFALKID